MALMAHAYARGGLLREPREPYFPNMKITTLAKIVRDRIEAQQPLRRPPTDSGRAGIHVDRVTSW
jgi:hypothetical protein